MPSVERDGRDREKEREREREREGENVGEIDGRHCQDIEMALSVAVDRHRTL